MIYSWFCVSVDSFKIRSSSRWLILIWWNHWSVENNNIKIIDEIDSEVLWAFISSVE
jgi:hypothetical protein